YMPQKPLVLIAQDNSQSVNTFKPAGFNSEQLISDLTKLKENLGDKYDVRLFHFDRYLHDSLSTKFDGKHTNISSAIHQLNERFANQNIGALVVATDGLYNQGSDPLYEAKNIRSNIYTVALGDTVAKRDLLIGNVNYNKTAFLGNDFEIQALAEAYQAKGENMHITVDEDGRQLAVQNVSVNSADFHNVTTFKLNADKKGTRKFTISISPVKN